MCLHSAIYMKWIATLHKQGISSWVCNATHAFLPLGCVNPTAGYVYRGVFLTARESFPAVISRVRANDSGKSSPLIVFHWGNKSPLVKEGRCMQSTSIRQWYWPRFRLTLPLRFHWRTCQRIASIFGAKLATLIFPCWNSGLGPRRGTNGPRQVHPGDLILFEMQIPLPTPKVMR